MTRYDVKVNFLKSLLFLILHVLPLVISVPVTPIPSDPAALDKWVASTLLPFKDRETELDPALATAEKTPVIIKVRKDGSGQFKTLTEAVNSIPDANTKRTIVWIGAGDYKEKVKVPKTKPFVTFYGDKAAPPKLTFDGSARTYGVKESATVLVESDYFMAVNIVFENTSPEPGLNDLHGEAAAEAIGISSDKASFFNCKFIGFQDTVADFFGSHFFKDCDIAGTVDFIWGNGRSLYLKSVLRQVSPKGGGITAQGREKEEEDTGYSFVHCTISGPGVGNTFLGRAWRPRGRVAFIYSYFGPVVAPLGWNDRQVASNDATVAYGEYMNKGPGADTKGRVKYSKVLTEEEAKPFLDINFIKGTTWLLAPPVVA